MLLSKGFELLQLGMGTVFLFLIILLFMIKLMSWLIAKFEQPKQKVVPSQSANFGTAIQVDKKTYNIIQKAMKQHFKNDA